ncbi:MAG TPA: hypothetical protein VGD43_25260 [Micromonospora sp.]
MIASMKSKAFAVSAVVALSLAVAGSASAATFSANGPTKLAGSLTWQQGGTSARVCGWNSNGTIFGLGIWSGLVTGTCAGGGSVQAQSILLPVTRPDGSVAVQFNGGGMPVSPYGQPWNRVNAVVPFVNGNASTPSKIVLDNTYVGYIEGDGRDLTVTGTIDVTTSTGGLVTINP